jgi:hypothetical protein
MTPTLWSPSSTSCTASAEHAEDLLGHEHATLVEMVADPAGPAQHDHIEREHHAEQDQHHDEDRRRVGLGREPNKRHDPRRIEQVWHREWNTAILIGLRLLIALLSCGSPVPSTIVTAMITRIRPPAIESEPVEK